MVNYNLLLFVYTEGLWRLVFVRANIWLKPMPVLIVTGGTRQAAVLECGVTVVAVAIVVVGVLHDDGYLTDEVSC